MARKPAARGLTENEREFLRGYVRTDVEVEHLDWYRKCKCHGSDSENDGAIRRRITEMLQREDVRIQLAAEKARYRLELAQQRRANGEVAVERQQTVSDRLGVLFDAMVLRAVEEESGNAAAKCAEAATKLGKMLLEADGGAGVSDAQLLEAERLLCGLGHGNEGARPEPTGDGETPGPPSPFGGVVVMQKEGRS